MQKLNLPTPITAEVGLVLMDLSLNLIACDRGAASILNYSSQKEVQQGGGFNIPNELLEMLRNRRQNDPTPQKTLIRIGLCEYVCRAYFVEGPEEMFTQPMLALHLERDLSASDAASEVGARYNLTEREMEALKGILIGLGSKEVAERMNISPNTVKAFLRLIMIKMGVTTRAGIVAKVLQNRATPEEQRESPVAATSSGSTQIHRPKRKEAAAAQGANIRGVAGSPGGERIGDLTGTETKLGAAGHRIVLGGPKTSDPH